MVGVYRQVVTEGDFTDGVVQFCRIQSAWRHSGNARLSALMMIGINRLWFGDPGPPMLGNHFGHLGHTLASCGWWDAHPEPETRPGAGGLCPQYRIVAVTWGARPYGMEALPESAFYTPLSLPR